MVEQETPPPDLVDLLRSLTPDDHRRVEPPASVWQNIAAAVESDGLGDGDDPPPRASIVVLDAVRASRARSLRLALAAAAALVVLAGTAAVLSQGDDTTVVATVEITSVGLPLQAPAPAVARLVDVNDSYAIDVDLPDLPTAEGFYEIWVIDTAVEGMYSLGAVAGSGRYDLPAGVDPAAFPVVDISVEPLDGNPTHSGQSIWRGVLPL